MPTRVCSRCGIEKELKDFGARGRSPCLACNNKQRRVYYRKNRKILYARAKLSMRRRPDAEKMRSLRFRYGISLYERNMLVAKQGGRCALCPRLFVGRAVPCVDHDKNHEGPKRERVRGILCHACNIALGIAESIGDIDRHPKMQRYVRAPPAWKWLKTNTYREE